MRYQCLGPLAALLVQASGMAVPNAVSSYPHLPPRNNSSCANGNTPTSRNCWTEGFDIDTNYYENWPHTGVTRKYFLDVVNITMAPDGYERTVLVFNGTLPGPTIHADWGDDIVVHVRNSLENNGTAIHWHGMHMRGTSEADGVPGVTQCPQTPGDTMTYRFKATQYGTTWYHSHFTLQYGDGLVGPLVIRGPSTGNYDEDLGSLFLTDWSHQTVFDLWHNTARHGPPPQLESGLINGTNIFDCSKSNDTKCVGGSERFSTTFEPGKKYLIRLVNSALDGSFKFTIDNHRFTVVANDLVPIKPYETNQVLIGIGQRYDIIVEADQDPSSYWLRAVWMNACNQHQNPNNFLGIVQYKSTNQTIPTIPIFPTTPTSTQWSDITDVCGDEPSSNLVPHLSLTVGDDISTSLLHLNAFVNSSTNLFFWTINSSSLLLEWEDPTTLQLLNDDSIFPTDYNSYAVPAVNQWVYWVIQAPTNAFALHHPIHLHGHDFFVIGQRASAQFDPANPGFQLENPVRRDVADLPPNGYLAIAFFTDNPGAWLIHCHIAWHASQGLSLQFVERESEIKGTIEDGQGLRDRCEAWREFEGRMPWPQDDSGI